MARKNKTGKLSETGVIMTRQSKAEALESEKLDIKVALEKCMRRYAKISGMDGLAERKYKVGKAPNDYNFDFDD